MNLVEKTWGFGLDYDHAGPLFMLIQRRGDEISTIYCWGVVRGSLSPSGLHWLSRVFLFWRVCCLFFVIQGNRVKLIEQYLYSYFLDTKL